jgi:hypothetical protein
MRGEERKGRKGEIIYSSLNDVTEVGEMEVGLLNEMCIVPVSKRGSKKRTGMHSVVKPSQEENPFAIFWPWNTTVHALQTISCSSRECPV